MPTLRRLSFIVIIAALVLAGHPAAAQQDPAPAEDPTESQEAPRTVAPTSGIDRMYLSFFEDATIVQHQWWEGQLQFASYDQIDSTILYGNFAISPWDRVELGGRVGFGSTDSSSLPDGSGATDLDAYGKYWWGGGNGHTEFAAGAILTVPTGDDLAGLGTDQWALGGFGSLRYRLRKLILAGNLGVRFNGNAQLAGVDKRDGETSWTVGFGVIGPISDRLTVIAEAKMETERYEGGETDAQLLGGLNLRAFNRGMFRGAVSFGLTDGAPDWRVIVGYAHTF